MERPSFFTNSLLMLDELLYVCVITMELTSCHGTVIERLVRIEYIGRGVIVPLLSIQTYISSAFSETLSLFVLLMERLFRLTKINLPIGI